MYVKGKSTTLDPKAIDFIYFQYFERYRCGDGDILEHMFTDDEISVHYVTPETKVDAKT